MNDVNSNYFAFITGFTVVGLCLIYFWPERSVSMPDEQMINLAERFLLGRLGSPADESAVEVFAEYADAFDNPRDALDRLTESEFNELVKRSNRRKS